MFNSYVNKLPEGTYTISLWSCLIAMFAYPSWSPSWSPSEKTPRNRITHVLNCCESGTKWVKSLCCSIIILWISYHFTAFNMEDDGKWWKMMEYMDEHGDKPQQQPGLGPAADLPVHGIAPHPWLDVPTQALAILSPGQVREHWVERCCHMDW